MGSKADGSEDADVATAATEIAVEGIGDLGVGGLGCGFEQDDRSEDHAGYTVTALHGFGIKEGLLDAVKAAVAGEAFDGGDLLAFGETGGSKAGSNGLAVEEDSAGATLAFATAVLGAGEVEVFAEDFKEGPVWSRIEGMGLAVDACRHDRECIAWGMQHKRLE